MARNKYTQFKRKCPMCDRIILSSGWASHRAMHYRKSQKQMIESIEKYNAQKDYTLKNTNS